MWRKSLSTALLALLACPVWAAAPERIVVMTADVADVVVALGAAPTVIGRDRSSQHPALASAAVIGFNRSLSVEPIARLKPQLVLGSSLAQPATIWPQLQKLGIPAQQVSQHEDGRDFANSIREIGRLLEQSARAEQLAQQWQQGMTAKTATGVRYLFTYDGSLVAGKNTAADTLIRAAGGINIAEHDGFKPLSREAWRRLKPEVIVVADHNRAITGGRAGLLARPEIALTPAGQKGRVYELPAGEMFRIDLDSPKAVSKLGQL